MCTVSIPCQTVLKLSPAVTAASWCQCYILDYQYGQKLELKALPLLYSAQLSNRSVSTSCSSITKLEWTQSRFAFNPSEQTLDLRSYLWLRNVRVCAPPEKKELVQGLQRSGLT